jgi:hypothetical protein
MRTRNDMPKTYGEKRICEGTGCSCRLARSNPDEVCASCHAKIATNNLPREPWGVYL